MMGRLVSLRRRSRVGLGSRDSHPSFNFYVQYYVEATSGNMSPYPWKTAYKLIRESLQEYYLESLTTLFGGRRLLALSSTSTGQVTFVPEGHVIPFVDALRHRYYIMTVIVEVSLSLLRIYRLEISRTEVQMLATKSTQLTLSDT
jgi:hypothetical protein